MAFIYAIGASHEGPVKIGFTTGTTFKRLAELQTAHFVRLQVLAEVPVTPTHARQIERLLHGLFRPHALRGEWFAVAMTQEQLASMVQALDATLVITEALKPDNSPAPADESTVSTEDSMVSADDSHHFLEPESWCANFAAEDDLLTAQCTFTYGPDDQQVELLLDGPDTSEALVCARYIVDYYLTLL